MAQLSNVGTPGADCPDVSVPKVKYYKLSPATPRYRRLQKICDQEQIPLEEVIRNAIDFYLSFQEKKIVVVSPR